MEDRLKKLMQELGNTINGTLSDSDRIAAAIGEIKLAGYDVFLKLEATIGFNKREKADESLGAAATAEVVASPRGTGNEIANLAGGKVSVSLKQAGFNEGPPTPLLLPSTAPQRTADPPQPLAGPSTPPGAVLKTEGRLKGLMQELGKAINGTLSDSDRIAAAIGEIKRAGYDVFVTLEATIGFNKREKADESPEGAATAEGIATGTTAPYAAGKTPKRKVTASCEKARLNEGAANGSREVIKLLRSC